MAPNPVVIALPDPNTAQIDIVVSVRLQKKVWTAHTKANVFVMSLAPVVQPFPATKIAYVAHLGDMLEMFPENAAITEEIRSIGEMSDDDVAQMIGAAMSVEVREQLLERTVSEDMWTMPCFARMDCRGLYETLSADNVSRFWRSFDGVVNAVATWSAVRAEPVQYIVEPQTLDFASAVKTTYLNHVKSILNAFPGNSAVQSELSTMSRCGDAEILGLIASSLTDEVRRLLTRRQVFPGMWQLPCFARMGTEKLYFEIAPDDRPQFWESVAALTQATTTWAVMRRSALTSDIQGLSGCIRKMGGKSPAEVVQSLFTDKEARDRLLGIFSKKEAVGELMKMSPLLMEGWGIDVDNLSETMLSSAQQPRAESASDTDEDIDTMTASSIWSKASGSAVAKRAVPADGAKAAAKPKGIKFKDLVAEIADTGEDAMDDGHVMLDLMSELMGSGALSTMMQKLQVSAPSAK